MNKKLHSVLFTIGFIIPIEEESNMEKRNHSSVTVSLKSNYISNIFKNLLEEPINSHHNLKKYGRNRNFNHSIAYFQKITNSSDHLFNEINLNLNHQNMVNQPT